MRGTAGLNESWGEGRLTSEAVEDGCSDGGTVADTTEALAFPPLTVLDFFGTVKGVCATLVSSSSLAGRFLVLALRAIRDGELVQV